jgi:hypothetical protein
MLVALDLFDPLRDVHDIQFVLGEHLLNVVDVLHGDADFALGAPV